MALNEEIKEDLENIKFEIKSYINNSIEYYQLLGLKISSKAFSLFLKIFLLSLFLSIAVLFLSFAGAFALGNLLENNTLGFLIVGGFYLLISLFIYIYRRSIIDTQVIKKLSEIFYNN